MLEGSKHTNVKMRSLVTNQSSKKIRINIGNLNTKVKNAETFRCELAYVYCFKTLNVKHPL